MSSIRKPTAKHAGLPPNKLGLTMRDYEGAMSTLCAGCGHDSITAALIRALYEQSISPETLAKMSGIGCSSKTPTYFASGAHGFNAVHGRMPAVATGANAANRELIFVGISGDGDSLSIGLGQMAHAIRRNVRVLYIIENNGVYGLTKGQFSASADVGSKLKKGEVNRMAPIDPVMLGLSIGATFIARGFSGDKEQLVPILKAGLTHRGLALVDAISPCVTFNDHEGSTKSYMHTRRNQAEVTHTDFVPPATEITAQIGKKGETMVQMHDGSWVKFTALPEGYDPTDRGKVFNYLQEHQAKGVVPTGLLYLDEQAGDMHAINNSSETPLVKVPYEKLCPGSKELEKLMEEFR